MPPRLILGRRRAGMSMNACGPGGRIHCGTMSLVGRPDSAYGHQSAGGGCRLECVVGLISSTLNGPYHILRRASKLTRRLVSRGLGGGACVFSEMVDPPMSLRRQFATPSANLSPGMIVLEDCKSLLNHLESKKTIAEEYLVCHFLGMGHSLGNGNLGDAQWLPGLKNPADGLAEVTSDCAPPLRLLESGTLNPGTTRPLRGVFFTALSPPESLSRQFFLLTLTPIANSLFLLFRASGCAFPLVTHSSPFSVKWRKISLRCPN